jgi:hypothetical protein
MNARRDLLKNGISFAIMLLNFGPIVFSTVPL